MTVIRPMTPSQFLYIETGDLVYEPYNIHFKGELDTEILLKSLQVVVSRHDIWRVCFPEIDNVRVQCFKDELAVQIRTIDLSGVSEFELSNKISQKLEFEHSKPFDIDNGPLWRATLIKLPEQKFLLCFIISHALMDAWTLSLLFRELIDLYCSFATSTPSLLKKHDLNYGDYSVSLNKSVKDTYKDHITYWDQKIQNCYSASLKVGYACKEKKGISKKFDWEIPPELLMAIKTIATRESTSLFAMIISCFEVLFASRTDRSDFTIDFLAATERSRPGIDNLMGPCHSNLPLRIDLNKSPDFRSLVQQVYYSLLEGTEKYLPLGLADRKLVIDDENNIRLNKNLGPLRPFFITFVTSVPIPCSFPLPGVTSQLSLPRNQYEPLDLSPLKLLINSEPPLDPTRQRPILSDQSETTHYLYEFNGRLLTSTWYNSDSFQEQDIVDMVTDFLQTMETIVYRLDTPISDLVDQIKKKT